MPERFSVSAGKALAARWKLGLVAALLVPLVVAFSAWRWGRPWVNADTATGLVAWESWRAGGEWNCVREPDPANLARDVASWVSWWSPGQYVWPGLFLSMGLPLGAALLVSSVAAAWIRTAGIFMLLRNLGASHVAAAAAALAEAANWHLFTSFGMYTGGEVVQAALLPWLLLAISRLRNRPVWWPVIIPLLLFAAAFAKHTLFIAAVAALAWLWWETIAKPTVSWRRCVGTGLMLAACVVAARWAVSRWIIGPGPTPGDPGQIAHGWALAVGYPVFGPFSAATGVGSIAGRIFATLGINFNHAWQQLGPALAATAPLWIATYVVLARHLGNQALRRLLIAFTTIYVAIFVLLFLRGASISVEDRHFRPAGLILIVALAAIAIDSDEGSRRMRGGLLLLLLASSVYGLAAAGARIANLHRLSRVGPSGVMQANLSPAAAAELVRRDASGAAEGQVIVLCDPSAALEVRRSRRLVTDAMTRPLDWFHARRWQGRVPHLLLVLPAAWERDPRAAALRQCFSDFGPEEWSSVVVGDALFVSARG